MRAGWLVCLCLCACNRVLGLSATHEIDAHPPSDAQYFDAPADAPFACPPAGIVPAYAKLLHQVNDQMCQQYTISSDAHLVVAACYLPSYGNMIGPLDGELAPLVVTTQYTAIYYPAIAPEGDRIYAEVYDPSSMTYLLTTLLANGDSTWQDGVVQTLPFAFGSSDQLGVPSRGPQRRAFYAHMADTTWHDLVETTPDTWSDVRSYSASDLGVMYLYEAQLSGDALRLVGLAAPMGSSSYQVMYASRAQPSDPFPPMQPLAVPQGATYPFLTDDCSRVYFAGLGSTLYVQQQ